MPILNGQQYSTEKERQAILNASNPAKKSSSTNKSGGTSSTVSSQSGASGSSSGSSSSSSSYKTDSSGRRLYSDGYGGYTTEDPNSGSYAKIYGGSSQSAARPSSGGVSSSVASGSVSSSYRSDSRDYHQEARDAAAQGDWAKVSQALAMRQAKIDAQGGNDRGTSNAQILADLQNQYRSSYSALPSAIQNTLGMSASGALSGRGWEEGHDYLSEAQDYARAGDLEAAYDALRRRGFKMYDTGSNGGGTSQDQAYAIIQKLFDQGTGGAKEYQRQLSDNARLLAEHPTQFGAGTNPALANKHFVSADNQYIIYYDESGTPVRAIPNSASAYMNKYSDEYIGLLSRYYGGTDDYADTRRQMHNLDVLRTGNGRLIDQAWNWASGAGAEPESAWEWQYQPGNINQNLGQDKDALAEILARINSGETFSAPVQVPTLPRSAPVQEDIGSGGSYRSGGSSGTPAASGGGSGNGLLSGSTPGGYGGEDLSQYLREMYQQNLAAQLAQLRGSYEQNLADIDAQDQRISQAYYSQRNQAAAQNDLQRLYMAELGNYQGLNTGATGQLAMAQGMALQDSLSTLGAAESQDLAANGLARNQLSSAYRSSADSAAAQSSAQLAQALYGEYVRQIQAAEQAAAAQQAQANWEAQFNYQMQQDALAQQNWQAQFDYGREQDALAYQYQREQAAAEYQQQLAQLEAAAQKQGASNAWNVAKLALQNGVLPDEATLYAAGIDAGTAQSLAQVYQRQLAAKSATGSRSGSSGSTSPDKPRLTYSQTLDAIESGITTPEVQAALDYYAGSGAYQSVYGTPDSGKIDAYIRDINTALTNGNQQGAHGYVRSIWGNLSDREKERVQSVLSSYGIQYTP